MLQNEEPGRHLETSAETFYTLKKQDNWSEIVQELISSYNTKGCNMSLKLNFLHSDLEFFLKTWEPSLTNMAKVSTRTFSKCKRGNIDKGDQL
jgi:hypothetical protein